MRLHEIPGFENATFTILPIERLITAEYQRNVRNEFVAKITRNFSPHRLGCITVSPRDNGMFAIVDGQHRVAACRVIGIEYVPCIVFPLDKKEEALSFIGFNKDRNNMNANQVFWAEVEAGSKHALDVLDTVSAMGFVVKKSSNGQTTNPLEITAIQSVERLYRMYGVDHVGEVLSVIKSIWTNDKQRTTGQMITGIGTFIKRAENRKIYDRKKLVNTLNKTTPSDFVVIAAAHRQTFRTNMIDAMCAVLFSAYIN